MRRRVAVLLGGAALLLTPSAPGVPEIPGDPTPPEVVPVITGTAGDVGWYRSNVTVNWSVVDSESIILATAGCDARTLTADTVGVRLTCTAESDGGETTVSKTFKVDKTPPSPNATPSRAPDANGWYNHDVSVAFGGADATSGLASCSPTQTYGGPDTGSASVAGSCRDQAGNLAAVSFPLAYDETPPQATPSARAPDANGWFNHAVTVTFQGADATSGVATCTQLTYAGPDDSSVALSGTCLDRAGNQSASRGFTLAYDETAPQASATAARGPDVNGWYNRALTVSFSGSDAMSGLDACDAPRTYSGPDSATAAVTGSCRDRAGNAAPRSVVLKYDATAPQATATPSRAANAQGWFNAPLTVSFSATDATSGKPSCSAARSYAGPDSASASVAGTCTDEAGNVGSATLPLKYDATAPQTTATPSRAANANGWYRAPLTVTFEGTDGMSGIDSCDAAKSYSGPDAASAGVSGACRDRAGNTAAGALALKYDATAPSVTAAPARAPRAGGWYTAPIAVGFTGGDATSSVDSCEPAKTYAGPDNPAAAVSGTCVDKAGNVGSGSLPLKYDSTVPQVTATPSRAPDANGWYSRSVSVSFTGSDATSGLASCDQPKTYSGPDNVTATVTGSCTDVAGNDGARSLALGYDATPPVVTGATAARPPDASGWYRRAIDLGFHGQDATSGIASCTQVTYGGPDTPTASVAGACSDRAGNQSGSSSFALKYDATAPQVTASASRSADANGWYNRPLSVSFTGGDATSGLESCVAPKSYDGPDSPATAVTGTCEDKAGNVGTGSLPLAYDGTAPAGSATPSRPGDVNGWYNRPLAVSFAAADATSGLQSCPGAQSYAGPDAVAAVVSGTCVDKAGNGTLLAVALRYDATAPQAAGVPSRPADANGWYNRPLTVAFQGEDATSGVAVCTAPAAYAGPDTGGVSVTGSCTDGAGNASGTQTFSFKYDATGPLVTSATAVRPPDRDGWYNGPVAFGVLGSDALAGVAACPVVTYAGPDAAAASVRAACVDRAGNEGTRAFALAYDATGPRVAVAPGREPDANGWYNRPVTATFSGQDAVSGVASCTGPESYDGPDSALAVIGGFCLDRAGNAGLASLAVPFDATPPQVFGATPERGPDANGWYNRPLVVGFHGSDATSAIDHCTEARYAGPDATAASLQGSCRDRAGNASADGSFTLRYDATGPVLTGVTAKAGNGSAELSWSASADTVRVEVHRAGRLVYRGAERRFKDTRLANGVRYAYTVTAYDEAENAATAPVTARPTSPLLRPAAGAATRAPVRLAWVAVGRATHYNVQVWRRGKIFSVWPRGTSTVVPRTWTYRGRRYHLTPGRYRWFVWPGYGKSARRTYGPLLGSSSFVIKARRR
ncbi:MAG TPA: hypothetical protein VG144_05720 [Gaiellaceae bacterium]|nr:hypothetical protein [Gaiellaceae bacterium]